jgi:glycosyltransferase involved in cell wall biosynthesis
MTGPCVSVIVPAYNRERYLGAALDSVLAQDYRPLEIVVVDDGSTDGTARVARAYPDVRYLHQANQGVAAARNAGIAASRGELIAFLDSDDLWAPEKLRLQVGFLLEHPRVGYCLARMRNFLEPGCPPPPWIGVDELSRVEFGIVPGTLVARRDVFERVGGFDPRYPCGSDTDWFFRAKDAGIALGFLGEILLLRRVHDANLSASRGPNFPILARIVKASVARIHARRAGAGAAGEA